LGILEKVNYPEDIKRLSISELYKLAEEIREFLLYNIRQYRWTFGSKFRGC